MQVSSSSSAAAMSLNALKDLFGVNGSQGTGQQMPPTVEGGRKAPPPGPPPGPPPSEKPSQCFSADTLTSLLSAQERSHPSTSDIAQSLLDTFDADGDGLLGASEIGEGLSVSTDDETTALAERLTALDADGDGQLSAAELSAGFEALFQSYASNASDRAVGSKVTATA